MNPRILALAAILLLAAAVRFFALGEQPLWLDEQGQLSISRADTFAEFWSQTRRGVPIGRLSYVDTWLALELGAATRGAFRIPAALWGVAAVFMTFVLGRRWFSVTTGLFAAALLSVHALHIQYSREARGYALLTFITPLFAWLLDRIIERFTFPRALALAAAALAGTQIHPVFLAPMWALSAVALVCLWRERGQRMEEQTSHSAGPVMGQTFLSASPALASSLTILLAAGLSSLIFALVPRDAPTLIFDVPVRDHSLLYYFIDIHKSLLGGYWGVLSYAVFAAACAGTVSAFARCTGFSLPVPSSGRSLPQQQRALYLCVAAALTASAPIILGYFSGTWIVSRYSIFALPFFMILAAKGFSCIVENFAKRDWLIPAAALALPLILWGGMALQGRSIQGLEQPKHPDSRLPDLPR